MNINNPPKFQELITRVEELNTQMLDEAAEDAARAFNLGCALSGFFVGTITALAWLLSNWIAGLIALLMTVLISIGVSTLLATRARNNNLARIYHQSIKTQLQEEVHRSGIASEQWESLVEETLSDDSPLVLMMAKFPLEGQTHG